MTEIKEHKLTLRGRVLAPGWPECVDTETYLCAGKLIKICEHPYCQVHNVAFYNKWNT